MRADTTKPGQCVGLVTIALQQNPAGHFFTFADDHANIANPHGVEPVGEGRIRHDV